MVRKATLFRISAIVLLLWLPSQPAMAAGCYPNPPEALAINVDWVARQIVAKNDADVFRRNLTNLLFFTVADATVGIPKGVGADVESYQFLGETARTDKQLSSSPKSTGSTSLVEKPGFAQLLGFAVDRGAIKQAVDGTTLTLSTSPYAFVALANRKDTAQLYQDMGFLNRLGISASFDITNQNDIIGNVTEKQLTEWSAKARLTPDHGGRSGEFTRFWRDKIEPLLARRWLARVGENQVVDDPFVSGVFNTMVGLPGTTNSTFSKIASYLTTNKDNTNADQKVADIKEIIYCDLRQLLYDPLKQGAKQLNPTIAANISQTLALTAASMRRVEEASQLLKDYLAEVEQKPEATLEYTNHRLAMASDYSEMKLLFRVGLKPLKLTANAGVSVYNNPDKMLNQQKVRDYTAALAFEGGTRSPFVAPDDLSKITYTFSGSYERLKENEGVIGKRPDIASVQFKLEIPVYAGFSIPISYTYSSSSETSIKKENKFNIGLHLDIDKLYALTRARR
ncbi:MAG: hypothetical protein ACJ74J_12865 [Blastocatellia bacterium]